MTTDARDLRQERAALAAASARANLPTSVFILSLGLFVVAMVALIWCAFSRRAAQSELDSRLAQAQAIIASVNEIKTLKAQIAHVKDTRSNDPLIGIPLKLQQAASNERLRASITGNPAVKGADVNDGSVVLRRYSLRGVQHESIDDIMSWIDQSLHDIKGLEVDSIELTPSQNNWTINITFSRWEKKEG